jgi:transcriptional regulator with XRE-family HTH domain
MGIMWLVGKNIQSIRHQKKLTLEQLEELTGISNSYLSRIERNEVKPSPKILEKIADILGVPIVRLFADADLHDETGGLKLREVPFFGYIPAGPPEDCVADMGAFPVLMHLWKPSRYALKITSDSMIPTLLPGDVVLVEWRPDYNPETVIDQICVVWLDGGNTVKRVVADPGKARYLLEPDNRQHKSIPLWKYPEAKIQGVVLDLVHRHIWG